jgi:L-2-hydroxyglutarate oxidase LhgO
LVRKVADRIKSNDATLGVEPTRIYEFEDARAVLTGAGLDAEVLAREVGGRVMGAFVRARKPA